MNDYGTFTVLVRADKDSRTMRRALADPFSLIVSPRWISDMPWDGWAGTLSELARACYGSPDWYRRADLVETIDRDITSGMSEEEMDEFYNKGGVFAMEEAVKHLTWKHLSDAFDDPNIMVLIDNIPGDVVDAIRENPKNVHEILAGLND
ncbi:hypothetical protein [uncultured Actinomyces sp.]|uniref:hypothetical protein n=1 Tax=uncultured Actinomyces sp. TaxID=249061 RepID=UPI0026290EC7|nr:hypothetical protein [uncultured Actinomyces sp.]